MKPILILQQFEDGVIRLTEEELQTLIDRVYEAGKADSKSPLLYPTGVRRPGEYDYFKVRYSGDSNGG